MTDPTSSTPPVSDATDGSSPSASSSASPSASSTASPVAAGPDPKNSYVKLAMRNMVRKRGISLQHFFLTVLGLLGTLVGLSYLTKP